MPRYYQAPFCDNNGEASGVPAAGWIVRNLPIMPETNDDPSVVIWAELFNEAAPGNDQKYFSNLGRGFSYVDDAHGKGCRIASFVLKFQRKATANLRLIFERPDPIFHCLSTSGSPLWIGKTDVPYTVYPGWENFARCWDTNHHTRDNMSLALVLPWPNLVQPGQTMEGLIDPHPSGRNRMWIMAE